jgi:hypothetical protein
MGGAGFVYSRSLLGSLAGRVPPPPGKELELPARDFPIPFPGNDQNDVNLIAFSKVAVVGENNRVT